MHHLTSCVLRLALVCDVGVVHERLLVRTTSPARTSGESRLPSRWLPTADTALFRLRDQIGDGEVEHPACAGREQKPHRHVGHASQKRSGGGQPIGPGQELFRSSMSESYTWTHFGEPVDALSIWEVAT